MVFNTNVKDGKIEGFGDCSIIPTGMTLKVLVLCPFSYLYAIFLFVILCCRDMQRNQIQNMALPMYGTVLGVLT